MKKYNRFLLFMTGFFFVIGLVILFLFVRYQQELTYDYRIEGNEVLANLKDIEEIETLDLSKFPHIIAVDFLDNNEQDVNRLTSFYQDKKNQDMQLFPFYQNNQMIGIVKIVYKVNLVLISTFFFSVFLLYLIVVFLNFFLFFYLRRKLIKPFSEIKGYPKELAKGHFNYPLKVTKNGYFNEFIWGMDSLKDSLKYSKKMELQLLEEKKKLLLSLSHDIKTPLNLIQLYTTMLEEQEFNSKQYIGNLHKISEKTMEINQYIEEIIASSKQEILPFEVHNNEFYFSALWKKIIPIYQDKAYLSHTDFTIDSFDDCLIKGDLDRSQEVVENVLENAFKYGDGKKIHISFSREETYMLVHIYNSGETLLDNEWQHLFDSFFRGGNSVGKSGSGLGLYICSELMRRMNGYIYTEKTNQGIVFTLVFSLL